MVYELEAAGGNSKISIDWKRSRWAFLLRLTLVIEKLKTHRLRSFVSLLKTLGKTDELQQNTNKASNSEKDYRKHRKGTDPWTSSLLCCS